MWNELVGDRVSVWAQIRRVHRIRIVVIRILVLNFNGNKAWKIFRSPLLIQIVGLLLLNVFVSSNSKSTSEDPIVWVCGRRLGSKTPECIREMPVKNHKRILGIAIGIEVMGYQHIRLQVHRAPPEFSE